MNTRGEGLAYDLPQSAAVKSAAARLAGIRGRSGTAAPTPAAKREAGYLAQTGRPRMTAAQSRRSAKKQNRAAGGRR